MVHRSQSTRKRRGTGTLPLFGVYIIRLRVQCQAELVFRGNYGTPVSINPQTTELVLIVHSLGSYVLAQMTREIFVDCGLCAPELRVVEEGC